MSNAMMERQESLDLQLPKSVGVVGCGGVGHWIALFLALAGVQELVLFDYDTLSESNLNRVLHTRGQLGQPKTEMLRELIQFYRPDCRVLCFGKFTTEVATGIKLDRRINHIVAATDSVDSRRMIYKWAFYERGINYIEVAAEGDIGSIAESPADFTTPEESEIGYRSVPVWVGPAVQAATMAVSYILHHDTPNDTIRAGYSGENTGYSLYDAFKARGGNDDEQ
jgi:hypothetical protein